jgi:hypothetical protein
MTPKATGAEGMGMHRSLGRRYHPLSQSLPLPASPNRKPKIFNPIDGTAHQQFLMCLSFFVAHGAV